MPAIYRTIAEYHAIVPMQNSNLRPHLQIEIILRGSRLGICFASFGHQLIAHHVVLQVTCARCRVSGEPVFHLFCSHCDEILTGSIALPGGKVADHAITIRYSCMPTPASRLLRDDTHRLKLRPRSYLPCIMLEPYRDGRRRGGIRALATAASRGPAASRRQGPAAPCADLTLRGTGGAGTW